MKRYVILGAIVAGGMIAFQRFGGASRRRMRGELRRRMIKGMERMMENLPEEAPPKLIMSVLPRLREQNDQIIAMLKEQNELLRAQHTVH